MIAVSDPYNLGRFVEAQQSNYAQALAELQAGQKRSHWSWYVLPQIRGLGSSPMSIRYAITGLAEAKAYLEHPVLGVRLRETVNALLSHSDLSAVQILGPIDAQKFKSCLTLFSKVLDESHLFGEALEKYFAAKEDPSTVAILAGQGRDGGLPFHRGDHGRL